jgi:3-deoxy-7-phosphoheptulonate synthase
VHKVSDINILDTAVLPAPEYLSRQIKRSEEQAAFVADSRQALHDIIFGDDKRLLVVLGPCSIHDTDAGIEYARRLASLSARVADRMFLVMRVYFEKPRTTIGWKGLIMDPDLDGTYNIPKGLKIARKFLRDVIDLRMPTATELLDPITPQYIADLICWSAIGARTTESQTHRQMASGLSMPLGFKNGTSGDLVPAINAIKAASQSQTFLGISFQGLASAVSTKGNPSCHVILRGGESGPNYSADHVAQSAEMLRKNKLREAIMIDCSHANCGKSHDRQPIVFADVIEQSLSNPAIIGAMLESNLFEGQQTFPQPRESLVRGQSITDPCINWETTEKIVLEAYEKLAIRVSS